MHYIGINLKLIEKMLINFQATFRSVKFTNYLLSKSLFMRKLLFLGVMLSMVACSVENEDVSSEEIFSVDAKISVDGCSVYNLNLGDKGLITFRNYYDFLEVSVTNTSSLDLNSVSIHFTQDVNGFPKTGKGEMNPSKFYYSVNIDKGVGQVIKTFSFEELNITSGSNIYIAAAAEFGSGRNKSLYFAYDSELVSGSNKYFAYNVEPFVNYAGTDQIREITLSEAIALPSWDEVRKTYANMLDPGVNKTSGVYRPSIWDLIYDFNDPNRESQLGDYTTTYTLGSGECSDSVVLTLRVVPDPQ